MVKNKRILQEIAKRFAKSILKDSADFAFHGSGLSEYEQTYINEYMDVIAERITDLPTAQNADDLVNEYYD